MDIRSATPDDAEVIQAIYAPVVSDTTISFELEPPTVEEMRSRIVATTASLPWLVGLDDEGAVIGYVYAGKHRERAAYQWAVDVTAYVHLNHRCQGVGKALYERMFDLLTAAGYCQAFAGIALPNAASIALHESVGFAHIGVYRNVGFKRGAWHDVAWWQKELQLPVEPKTPQRPALNL